MPFSNHTPYDYLPRRLYLEDIGDPFLAIHKFFDWENLPEWRNHLDKWLHAALKSGFQLTRDELVELFVRYEFVEYLMEALFLINRSLESIQMTDIKRRRLMDGKENQLIPDHLNAAHGYFNNGHSPRRFEEPYYYPVYLNDEEKKYPYKTIKMAFDYQNLPQFRDALYWWFIVGIDSTSADDSRGNTYLLDLHKIMQKVVEAAHLIHIRTIQEINE